MTFPVAFHIGGVSVLAHTVCETLAYTIGFQVYRMMRRREQLPVRTAMIVILGATAGALAGSKILYWFENPALTAQHFNDFEYLFGGKTIVGGLLGGLIGVEFTKKLIGLTQSTGDDFVVPLIVGMCIGRVGCFLTGLSDDTVGVATTWFTGVDFGDGIPRHPAPLYEIAFLMMLVPLILNLRKVRLPHGSLFQVFMIAYLGFRLVVDSIKPRVPIIIGLGSIQLACVVGMVYYSRFVPGIVRAISKDMKETTDITEPRLPMPITDRIS